MQPFIKYWLLGFTLIVFLQVNGQRASEIDAFLFQVEARDKAMGSVAILQNGELTYQNSFGYASLNPNRKADSLTRYQIGSISKTFTAAVIMQMVTEGKISLNDKLSKFYPNWPGANQITLEYLLRHRSGIQNFAKTRDSKLRYLNPQTNEEIEEIFRNAKLDVKPGSKAEYNNANYVVLSLIAEGLDQMSFSEIVENRIARPLTLKRTGYGSVIKPKENEAHSYYKKRGKWIQNPEGDLVSLKGAGALVSTPAELCIFYDAIFRGIFFSEPLLQEMISMESGFGLGLFQYPFYDKVCYGHGGSIGAFESFAAYFPEEKVAVAICLNAGGEHLNDILKEILDIWFNK